MNKYTFTTLIWEVRRNLNVSRESASEDIGISCSALGAFESGARIPPVAVICRMAEYYGIGAAYLLEAAAAAAPVREPGDHQAKTVKERAAMAEKKRPEREIAAVVRDYSPGEFSKLIVTVRKDRHISRMKAARGMDIGATTLMRYETAMRRPSIAVINIMAAYYGVSFQVLRESYIREYGEIPVESNRRRTRAELMRDEYCDC